MKPRRVILRGPYPTVESTAKLMGVSEGRVKQLLRLVRSNGAVKAEENGAGAEEGGSRVSRTKRVTAVKKRAESASRKRRARGKTKAHA
jgi:hypothetical protein